MNLFLKALKKENYGRPPVWFMRQAGRYHSHYQKLKEKHSFIELCKNPNLACEVTLGPIEDFDFDAAILFSDLLFPLESLNMGLSYNPGPKLDFYLNSKEDIKKLHYDEFTIKKLEFQAHAIKLIREKLDSKKGFLGFIGAPLTLFSYAVDGSHQGELIKTKEALRDGRFELFFEKLEKLLVENLVLQADAGVDTILIIDTCAGNFTLEEYKEFGVSSLDKIVHEFKRLRPNFPLLYYSKNTDSNYWKLLYDLKIEGIGIDWHTPLEKVLDEFSERFVIQGNIDPHWLLENRFNEIKNVFEKVKKLPIQKRKSWICGLGHGVLQNTQENSVREFLRLQREIFHES
jgi:uroporphyrinogen decarboxylase